jgi:hypothetical protein
MYSEVKAPLTKMPISIDLKENAKTILDHIFTLLHLPPRQPRCPSHLNISLCKPAARLDQLHYINPLLAEHDGEADARDDPGPERVHFVGSHELERTGAVGVGEKGGEWDVGGAAGLEGAAAAAVGDGLEEGGGEEGRGEGEEVEGYEEDFIEGAEEKEYGLGKAYCQFGYDQIGYELERTLFV